MGYYRRFIDKAVSATAKKYNWATDVAQNNVIVLLDTSILRVKEKQNSNLPLTETEQKLMNSVKLFETDEEYLKHIKEKEKENEIMSKASTNVTTSTAVTTTSTTTSKWTYGTGYTTYNTPPADFSYHGRKNKTILPDFISICKMSQKKLKRFLVKELKKYYDEDKIFARDGFVFAIGDIPVMITAHMDTVHSNPIKDYYEWTEKQAKKGKEYNVHVLSSPQGIGGDDRCGIWAILQILSFGYKPFVLFNEDEEIGCVGATKFCKNNDLIEKCIGADMKFIIEMDRKNQHDLVFYDCDNKDFIYWCEDVTGWVENFGSCSDISYLAPEIGCAAVNLSCGYYDEHKTWHTVKIEEMFNTMATCIKLIEASEKVEPFEYVEKIYGYNRYYNGYYDDEDYGWNYGWGKGKSSKSTSGTCAIEFEYVVFSPAEDDWISMHTIEKGDSYAECYVSFFKNHPDTCWNDVLNHDEYVLPFN